MLFPRASCCLGQKSARSHACSREFTPADAVGFTAGHWPGQVLGSRQALLCALSRPLLRCKHLSALPRGSPPALPPHSLVQPGPAVRTWTPSSRVGTIMTACGPCRGRGRQAAAMAEGAVQLPGPPAACCRARCCPLGPRLPASPPLPQPRPAPNTEPAPKVLRSPFLRRRLQQQARGKCRKGEGKSAAHERMFPGRLTGRRALRSSGYTAGG